MGDFGMLLRPCGKPDRAVPHFVCGIEARRAGGAEMTILSMALLAALVVSMIANVALVSRLRAAKKRMEEWKNERYW